LIKVYDDGSVGCRRKRDWMIIWEGIEDPKDPDEKAKVCVGMIYIV
jgi:hypothetical protein